MIIIINTHPSSVPFQLKPFFILFILVSVVLVENPPVPKVGSWEKGRGSVDDGSAHFCLGKMMSLSLRPCPFFNMRYDDYGETQLHSCSFQPFPLFPFSTYIDACVVLWGTFIAIVRHPRRQHQRWLFCACNWSE